MLPQPCKYIPPKQNTRLKYVPPQPLIMEDVDGSPPPPPYTVLDPNRPPQASVNSSAFQQTSPKEKEKKIQHASKDLFHVSGAPYFAMHPSSVSPELPILVYRVPILLNASAGSIHFPGRDCIMRERQFDEQDWLAFLNHLNLQHVAASTSREGRFNEEEEMRLSRINAVNEEWNDGFFLSRGLHIILDVEEFPDRHSLAADHDKQARYCGSKKGAQSSLDESIGPALYQAVSKGDAALVQILLDSGATANHRPSCAKSALTKAVEKGDWHIVQMLLERGQPDLEVTAPGGETALYAAVSKGNEELVKLLLRYGANSRAKPSGGEPAIYKATSKGFKEITRLLLGTRDIDVDATPPGGSSSLYKAREKGSFDMMELLLKKGANPDKKPSGGATTMYKAAEKDELNTTRMLLEYGANPDATPPGGNTALYIAAKKDREDMAQMLVNYGADVNKKSSGSNSTLWIAAEKSNILLRQLLLSGGASVDAVPWGGNTALWHASKRGDLEVARLLLEHGAKPDETTMGGKTALLVAAGKYNIEMARLLMDWGADPHLKSAGETPILRAGLNGQDDKQRLLKMMLAH